MNSSSGNSEAITAAVRALVGSSASKIPRRSLSSSQEGSKKHSLRQGSECANEEPRRGSEEVRNAKTKKKGSLATSESATMMEILARKGARDVCEGHCTRCILQLNLTRVPLLHQAGIDETANVI